MLIVQGTAVKAALSPRVGCTCATLGNWVWGVGLPYCPDVCGWNLGVVPGRGRG